MKKKLELSSSDQNSTINIEKGELISYKFDEAEIMHQKGDKGWGSTEIEMFPIIGATKENDFKVQTPKGNALLDQHGIARIMDYQLMESNETTAVYSKKYVANSLKLNHKFPQKSTQEFLYWPYNFEIFKTFNLNNNYLKISLEVKSDKGMPFMLGFHPAFKIYNDECVIKSLEQELGVQEILDVGAAAFLLEGCNELALHNNGTITIKVKTSGFRHIMLWTEVTNMVCIEPITFYPFSVSPKELHKGFDFSNGNEKFEITISPEYE